MGTASEGNRSRLSITPGGNARWERNSASNASSLARLGRRPSRIR